VSQVTSDEAKALVSGPVTGGWRGWVFGTPTFDVGRYGYREDEYFLEGLASRYQLVGGGERSWNGRWSVEPVGRAPFKTRFVVFRPTDSKRFNGTVLLRWNNVSAGFDTLTLNPTKLQDGFCVVTAAAQRVGMYGMGENPTGLRTWDPERYGDMSISSDDYSFDIFSQTGRTVGRDRELIGIRYITVPRPRWRPSPPSSPGARGT
jgi:hypothetical protein